jgi:hypothetical protein
MPVPLGVGVLGGLTGGRHADPSIDRPEPFHVTLSSVLHALVRVVDLGLALNSVVLPELAGAEMRVSLRYRPLYLSSRTSAAFNRSIGRGRDTSLVLSPVEGSGRTGGI